MVWWSVGPGSSSFLPSANWNRTIQNPHKTGQMMPKSKDSTGFSKKSARVHDNYFRDV